jgi:hypothetical protein
MADIPTIAASPSDAQRERERIIGIFEAAVIETTRALLISGLPGGTAHQRAKQRATLQGFMHATDCLKRAIYEDQG